MNAKDKEMLTAQYLSAESEVNNSYEYAVIRMQDAAYQMGLERGQGNINKVIAVFEQMTVAIDDFMTGKGTELQRLNAIEEAYDAMTAMNKELQQ